MPLVFMFGMHGFSFSQAADIAPHGRSGQHVTLVTLLVHELKTKTQQQNDTFNMLTHASMLQTSHHHSSCPTPRQPLSSPRCWRASCKTAAAVQLWSRARPMAVQHLPRMLRCKDSLWRSSSQPRRLADTIFSSCVCQVCHPALRTGPMLLEWPVALVEDLTLPCKHTRRPWEGMLSTLTDVLLGASKQGCYNIFVALG